MLHQREPDPVGIIDAGIGNSSSLLSSLKISGVEAVRVTDARRLADFRRVILPGVGNFSAFGRTLRHTGFWSALIDFVGGEGKSLLGICVGAQILQNGSEESPSAEGLSVIEGVVRKVAPGEALEIPRVGWDYLDIHSPNLPRRLTTNDPMNRPRYFFSHSFCMNPVDKSAIIAVCSSSKTVPAIVGQKGVLAIQFHPERSGVFGRRFLQDFVSGEFFAA